MTRGWETGSARVARVPTLVAPDHIYINSSHSNQANTSNGTIWVQVSQNRGSFLPVAPVPVQVSQNVGNFLPVSVSHVHLGKGREKLGVSKGKRAGAPSRSQSHALHAKTEVKCHAADGGEIEGGTCGRHFDSTQMDGDCLGVGHRLRSHYDLSNFGSRD